MTFSILKKPHIPSYEIGFNLLFDKLEVIKGDITQMKVDAIVNSAHPTLLAGSGVCGAIHRAAGKELEKECLGLLDDNPYPHQVPLTTGHNLQAQYVLHTIVPRAQIRGTFSADEKKALIECYKKTIYTANRCGLKTIAFPSLGTGIRGYPLQESAELAVKAIIDYLDEYVFEAFNKIYMVTHSDEDFFTYQTAYQKYVAEIHSIHSRLESGEEDEKMNN